MTLIPAGAQTYSKAPSQFPANAPRYARSGFGASVRCSDGKWYNDWTAALGPIVLGYQHPEVNRAVRNAVSRGPNFGLPTEIEEQVAERLCRIIPGAEAVRFGKNGSDVTAAAVRAARALTGRDLVLSDGYHGWSAEVGGGPNSCGVVDAVGSSVRPLMGRGYTNDHDEVGAVIVEPDRLPQERLLWLREHCSKVGAVLIFDEVLTGFRLNLGGAQAHYGVRADLVCLSKAMGNGYSVAAVCGPEKFMRPFAGGIGYSMTFAGETIGLAAAAATIDFMTENPVIDHLWRIGTALKDGWNAIAQELELNIPCEGNAPRTIIKYPSLEAKTLVLEKMWDAGQMFTVGFTPTYAHTDEHVAEALDAARSALSALAAGQKPKGRLVGEVFRR